MSEHEHEQEEKGEGAREAAAGAERNPPPPSAPPPRAVSGRKVALFVGLVAASLYAGGKWGGKLAHTVDAIWADLAGGEDAAEHAAHGGQWYTCGMHPWVLVPKPGLCPICNMDLTPVDPAKFTGEVTIDPVVTQNMGVRIAEVQKGPLVSAIRTVGSVEYDEARVRDVNVKFAGWIEKLHVDSEGAQVRAGQPLFEIYSPELYSAQEEYLLALRSGGRGIGGDLLAAARTKLEYFDIKGPQIDALAKRGAPVKTMTVRSPHAGVVTAKHANEGMRLTPGMRVYQIADLSKIWVMVTLYEYQLPYVEVGLRAQMTLPYAPGEVFEGAVVYVYPYLDEKTRQAQVRLEFDNPSLQLKPGMYATVTLEGRAAGDRVLAAREAVIDTGERQVAFVSLGEGRFEPREVRMGLENADGQVEILEGLKPGEQVVTSGQFLLDSEAKVREALAKMIKGDTAAEQEAVVPVAEGGPEVTLPPAASEALAAALGQYLALSDTMASDSFRGVSGAARALGEQMRALTAVELPGQPHFWHQHPEAKTVADRAEALAGAGGLEEGRRVLADLSDALAALVKATGVPAGVEVELQQLHCPMFRGDQGGASWLQAKGPVRNPYYGAAMLKCFDSRELLVRAHG